MEAFLYEPLKNNKVRCRLCRHHCVIKDQRRGICGVRENKGGILHTQVFGRLIARHIDPIEKKPLYHFLPGTLSYSIATVGCNFKCRFCQNADIAQMPADHEGMIVGESAMLTLAGIAVGIGTFYGLLLASRAFILSKFGIVWIGL
jgi:pyruvate formate lyase activating enzyme